MNIKARDIIRLLSQHPEADIKFMCDKNFGSECGVDMGDFEYDKGRDVFILPNLCCCYPEPD